MAKGDLAFFKMIVDDLDRVANFYKDVFGMHELFRMKESITDDMPIEEVLLTSADNENEQKLNLMLVKMLDKEAPKDSTLIIGFLVGDIAEVCDSVLKNGGKIIRPASLIKEQGVICAVVSDISNCLIELVQPYTQ